MRYQRVSTSPTTGQYGKPPLPAVRLEKRKGSDEELIVPPAVHQHPRMLEDFSLSRSWSRILPKRVEGRIDKAKIMPPALNSQRKMKRASYKAARSLTRVIPKSVEARDQCQVLSHKTEDTRDQDNGISPVLYPLETLGKTSSNAEKSFTCVLPTRVEEARDTCQDIKESSSGCRDEADDDRHEAFASYSVGEEPEHFFVRPTTPLRENSSSLIDDLLPLSWLYNNGSRATDKNGIELVLLLWKTNTLKVKIVDGRSQQVVTHSLYLEQDEMQEVDQVSSKPREEEPRLPLIPANTLTLTRNSNSIADDTYESQEESDLVALESWLCGFFSQEKSINEIESSSTLGPEDIPSEISIRCHHHHHHHHHHHAHSSKTHGVLSNDFPTATSMVVSDVSSNSTDASDWSSESSESSSVSSRHEPTFNPETQACRLVVNQRRRPVEQGRWKKFFPKLKSQS